jgi:CelD/BcsL family acetyltransferase involved in cellulose biosynthesis
MREVLRRAIGEGLAEYDFLGASDPHKLRWGTEGRRRVGLRGYRGTWTLPAYAFRAHGRPFLGRVRRGAARALPR